MKFEEIKMEFEKYATLDITAESAGEETPTQQTAYSNEGTNDPYADYSDNNINNNSRSLAYISYKYKSNNYNDDEISYDYKNLVDRWAAFYETTV